MSAQRSRLFQCFTNDRTGCVHTKNSIYRTHSRLAKEGKLLYKIEMNSYIKTRVLNIELDTRNILQIPFVLEALQTLGISYQYFDGSSTIQIFFNPKEMSPDLMIDRGGKLFATMRKNELSAKDEFFLNAGVKQFVEDLNNQFPGGNLSEREGCDCHQPRAYENDRNFHAQEMGVAVHNGDFAKVLQVLQKGVDANCRVFNDFTPLISAIYNGEYFPKTNRADYNKIVMLLLIYGADPYETRSPGCRNSIDYLIDSVKQDSEQYNFIKNVLCFITAAVRLPSPDEQVQVHPNDQSPMAKLIRELNDEVNKSTVEANTQYEVNWGVRNGAVYQSVKANDGTELEIHTETIEALSKLDEMIKLFKPNYPWQVSGIAESALEKSFIDEFIHPTKEAMVDFVLKGGQLIAFNIAEIDRKIIDGEEVIFHHILLAVGDPADLKKFKRVMSLNSFQRGFILQRDNPNVRIITGFEAASDKSFMQVRDLDFFPMFSKDLEPVVKALYPHASPTEGKAAYHITDKWAYQAKRSAAPGWYKRADMAMKFCTDYLESDGKSFIIAFDNNPANAAKLAKSIDPLLKNTTFSQIVAGKPQVSKKNVMLSHTVSFAC